MSRPRRLAARLMRASCSCPARRARSASRRAGPLTTAAEDSGLKRVGIFRDAEPRDVIEAAADARAGCGPAARYRSGRRGPPRARFRAVELWAACAVADVVGEPRAGADRIVFDSGAGGTGRAFDWSLVEGHGELGAGGAGGRDRRGQCARGAKASGPMRSMSDRGVEAEPGRKDGEKLRALFAALRPDSRRVECA